MATFKGIIEKVLPEKSGVSANGTNWRRASYILTYDKSNEKYPKSILFDVNGDKIDVFGLKEGNEYELEIDFQSREWNGKYFLSASCWKVTLIKAAQVQAPTPQAPTAPVQSAPTEDAFPF